MVGVSEYLVPVKHTQVVYYRNRALSSEFFSLSFTLTITYPFECRISPEISITNFLSYPSSTTSSGVSFVSIFFMALLSPSARPSFILLLFLLPPFFYAFFSAFFQAFFHPFLQAVPHHLPLM